MTLRRRTALAVALLAVATAGCTAPAPLDGAHVDVVGLWSGPEHDAFATVAATWEEDTGAVVDWHGSQDVARDLAGRLGADDPPDVAILPNPGLLHDLADRGALIPLDRARYADDYSSAWLDLGSHDGELYGVLAKVSSKATVWYSPPTFAAAGYAVPETWDALTALADQLVADGRTPFSVVAPTGPGSGWALTDWVSQLVLSGCGPEVYDAWVAAQVPWTDPCIRGAFDRFVAMVAPPGHVLGGSQGIRTTSDADGVLPLFTDPPGAAMYPMASFAQGFIASAHPDLVPGADYDWFPFPPVDPERAGAITVGGDVVVMMRDTPAARSFLAFLTGADAQTAWVELGGYTSANRSVPADAYADPVARSLADDLATAPVTRFGAGDLMPAAVQRAWWAGMLDLVDDPTTLDALLGSLTAAR
jgi:alpha-glucoside transport system substrate-binding protein